jgi:hypothetical protein
MRWPVCRVTTTTYICVLCICLYASPFNDQELVNLLLIGRAHSNVFDGQQTLGATPTASTDTATATAIATSATAANSDEVVLRGVTHRGPVGFLTLFEAYGHAAVGDRYKCPLHPVWVVCSESHYSVLFATQAQPAEVSIITNQLHKCCALGCAVFDHSDALLEHVLPL